MSAHSSSPEDVVLHAPRVMGFASVAELDEAIGRMNRILAEAA